LTAGASNHQPVALEFNISAQGAAGINGVEGVIRYQHVLDYALACR